LETGELQALGLYDPADEHAALRLELLEYLVALGASTDDLLFFRDRLPGLAATLGIRGGPGKTLAQVARSSGLGSDEIRRLARAAGFPDPDPDTASFTEGFVDLVSAVGAASEVFGEDGFYQLVRVIGAAMARVADAVVSAFLVEVEPAARREDPVGLAVAHANFDATALLPLMPGAFDVLFRQHLLLSQRTAMPNTDLVGVETQRLVVGFVDMVGSSDLAAHLSLSELGAVLRAFEDMTLDTVTRSGGRVVKLIGDEVLFTAPGAPEAGRIALEIAAACERHDLLPELRIGLAGGEVMLRDGDVFGPVVNLAARLVKTAQPGEVLATLAVADGSGLPRARRGAAQLKGIGEPTEVAALLRR
jgi:class 3 adenylate cyclase